MRPADPGFTLIEVLVALAIVAIALVAALKAVANLAEASDALHRRLVAGWSAQNRLAEIRLRHEWPEVGTRQFGCSQGNVELVCIETVEPTPNPVFRRIIVKVQDATRRDADLTQLIGLVPNESARPL
jgi:general secretion pathway protein I